MTKTNRWLLPDGVDEILPPQANNLETLRRDILNLYRSWGYELVITPLIEFLDSLSIVPGEDLQLETFKVVDQLSGRTMGIRADITSQVARIDAHVMKKNAPNRLCYADSVLRTKPSVMLGSRSPYRIGAELYGHSGIDSDLEIISLMLETLKLAEVGQVQLALGHVGIYRSLIAHADLDTELERKLFAALQSKSEKDIDDLLVNLKTNGGLLEMLKVLPKLSGDETILDTAEQVLSKAPDSVREDIAQLRRLSQALKVRYPEQSLYFDLSELRGYEYHTGVVFAAYTTGFGTSIAKGGRYDDIGKDFGRARAATGFDSDLKNLLALSKREFSVTEKIMAPANDDNELQAFIETLRAQGKQVLTALSTEDNSGDSASAQELGCTQEIVQLDGKWTLNPL
ncbi:ATP phosphoribosyltransferase regulatory subunit [Haliea sp. AH-315-K21]|uniref:ATP phosphoribosyltransferase regulatory subunit n=1 Tax=SAR86 cluster bacterium TaxID=2030880 RepID=A0A2A5C9M8_9GAMM|nr:ATP phosphoribosyltransferase regulatory subunit [Haliea sp. AH-315-K21]PCJ40188.1 MAG: ATP phosphoribosyltransferase regulatory subunit [SAR86 cluster bacterium]